MPLFIRKGNVRTKRVPAAGHALDAWVVPTLIHSRRHQLHGRYYRVVIHGDNFLSDGRTVFWGRSTLIKVKASYMGAESLQNDVCL